MRSRPRLVIAIAALSALISTFIPAGPATATGCPTGTTGAGTSLSPCIVTNQAGLEAIANGLGLTYQLANNITLTGTWSPIAPYPAGGGAPFTGVLDGNGYTIAGLRTTDTTAVGVGLFGVARGATVKRLHLTDASVAGATAVGAIAGFGSGLTIERVRVEGAVQATGQGAGGLVGYALDFVSSDAVTSAVRVTETMADNVVISAGNGAGGFAGVAAVYVIVENSFVSGSISATTTAAGFLGSTGLFADNSLSVATLSGDTSVRGLAGSGADSDAALTFFDSVAAGTTSAGVTGDFARTPNQLTKLANYAGWDISAGWNPGSTVWGICQSPDVRTVPFLNWTLNALPCTPAPPGAAPTVTTGSATGVAANDATLNSTVNANDEATSVTFVTTSSAVNAAARIGTSHTASPATTDGTSNTSVTAAVTDLEPNTTYYYWVSATNVWGTSNGSVQTFTTPDGPPPLVACSAYDWPGGSGTTSDPYLIDTYLDLRQATRCPTASFRQRADVSLVAIDSWTPIGTEASRFSGTYDGGGHDITGLTVSSTGNYAGLFGVADGATIRNIALLSGGVTGRSSVGGLLGYGVNITINDVHTTVAVTADHTLPGSGSPAYYVGGLVGFTSDATITSSSATGTVTATYTSGSQGNHVGGLIGYGEDLQLTDSWATGSAVGNWDVGGLVGTVLGESAVTRSSASGNATGATRVGGLLGEIDRGLGTTATVTDSYATGNPSAGGNVGGLIGLARDVTSITRSYSTGAPSGAPSMGGFVGWANTATSAPGSFWDVETSALAVANSASSGSVSANGRSTAQMKDVTTYSSAGWSIAATCASTSSVWAICLSTNNGYPTLTRDAAPEPTPDPTPRPAPRPTPEPTPSQAVTSPGTVPSDPGAPPASPTSFIGQTPAPLPLARTPAAGRAVAFRNGQPAEAGARRGAAPSSMVFSGPGFEARFTGVFQPPANARSGRIDPALIPGRPVSIAGSGAAPGSTVAVYLLSTPRLLTTMTADARGRYTGAFSVPRQTVRGEHALQMALRIADGDLVNASVGVEVVRRASGTITTTIHFAKDSSTLSTRARSALKAFERSLDGGKDLIIVCSAVRAGHRAQAAPDGIAAARSRRSCDFLEDRGIPEPESIRATTRADRTGPPRSVRVTATGTFT